MPWLEILLLIAFAYCVVMAVKGIRDFIIWYREGRDFARERKRLKDLRQKAKTKPEKAKPEMGKPAKMHMPALKERTSDSSKSSIHGPKPHERPRH